MKKNAYQNIKGLLEMNFPVILYFVYIFNSFGFTIYYFYKVRVK